MKSGLQLLGALGVILALLIGFGVLQFQLGFSSTDGDHLIPNGVLAAISDVIGVAALGGSFFVDCNQDL